MTLGKAAANHIRTRLDELLAPVRMEIVDDSRRHAGHAGARESGGGHFVVTVVSAAFAGRRPLERHRMVYDALGSLKENGIHALTLTTLAPEEDR